MLEDRRSNACRSSAPIGRTTTRRRSTAMSDMWSHQSSCSSESQKKTQPRPSSQLHAVTTGSCPPRPNVKYRKRKSFVGSTRAPGPGRLPWPRTPQRTRSRSADRGGEPALCHQPAVCDLPGRAASVVARCDVRTRPAFRSDATWHRGRRYRRNAGGRHVGSNRCEGSLEKSAFRSDADRRPRTGYSCTRTTPPAGPIVTLRTANSAPSSRTS